jgi:hypothetical protein
MLSTSSTDRVSPAVSPVMPPEARTKRAQRALIRRRSPADDGNGDWVLELEPGAEAFLKPLTGWVGARVRLDGLRFDFPTLADAAQFAQRHGWLAEIRDTGRLAAAS